MQGERGSVFKSIFLSPLVWIGLVLMLFTINNAEGKEAFSVFFEPETYRNLAIGTAIYVGLFDKKYTEGMVRLDIGETLLTVIYDMAVILLVWGVSLALVVNYQLGGESYKEILLQKYRKADWTENVKEDVMRESPLNVDETLQQLEVESGKRYKITPNDDGSIVVEVQDE